MGNSRFRGLIGPDNGQLRLLRLGRGLLEGSWGARMWAGRAGAEPGCGARARSRSALISESGRSSDAGCAQCRLGDALSSLTAAF